MTETDVLLIPQSLCGEWSDTLNAWFFDANNCEFVAYTGSHDIFVYSCDKYPAMAEKVIHGDRRIESLEDFDHVLNNGVTYNCAYTPESN